VKKSNYLGSNFGIIRINRYSRNVDNIKYGIELLVLNAKRAGLNLLSPRINSKIERLIKTRGDHTSYESTDAPV
jgi:hypothetical protein